MARKKKAGRGRDTLYTPEIADFICEKLAQGWTLNQICRQPGMPARPTVMDWVLEDREGFSDRYMRARELMLEHWSDETVDISDDARNDWVEREGKDGETYMALDREHVDRSRLRVETRKWLLVKLRPDKYGERIKQEHSADKAFMQLWQQMGNKP